MKPIQKKSFVEKVILWIKSNWNIITIVLLGFIVYSNSFQNSFHFDDNFYIRDSKLVNDIAELGKAKYWLDPHFRIYPTLSFAINYQMDELNVEAYHIVNILIHIISALIVFLLSKQILAFNKKDNKEPYLKLLPSIIALIFLVHPVQTSSVNYIVQRMTLMSSLFYLLGVWLYIKARMIHLEKSVFKALPMYLATLFSFYFAIFSKQIAASFPLMIFMIELLFIRNKERKVAKLYLISLGSAIIIGSLFLIIGDYLPREYDEFTRETYLASQFEVVLRYWRLLLFPYPLNFDPYVEVQQSLWNIKSIGYGFIHLLILSFAVWFTKKNKWVSFGIFWFYIALLVESSMIPIRDLMYEHRMYLPSFGFVFSITVIAFDFLNKKYSKTTGILVFIAVIMSFSIWSFQRNKVWKSDLSLWTDVAKTKPTKARAHKYLGVEYLKLGQLDKSLKQLNIAIKKQPNKEWEPYSNRASVYKAQRKFALAIDDMSRCIKMDPNISWFYRFRAEMYLAIQNSEKAFEDLNQALELDPNNLKAKMLRINYLMENKLYFDALDDLNDVLEYEPENILVLYKKASILNILGKYHYCLEICDEILSIKEGLYDVYSLKGEANLKLREYALAIDDYSQSIKLNPKFGGAYYGRGLAYYYTANYTQSVKDFRNAKDHGVNIDRIIFGKAIEMAAKQK